MYEAEVVLQQQLVGSLGVLVMAAECEERSPLAHQIGAVEHCAG